MIIQLKNSLVNHESFQVGEDLLVDATTEFLYITFPMANGAKKQSVFAKGRDKLMKANFQNKFRFKDDIYFNKSVINGIRTDCVTVQITYSGKWNVIERYNK